MSTRGWYKGRIRHARSLLAEAWPDDRLFMTSYFSTLQNMNGWDEQQCRTLLEEAIGRELSDVEWGQASTRKPKELYE